VYRLSVYVSMFGAWFAHVLKCSREEGERDKKCNININRRKVWPVYMAASHICGVTQAGGGGYGWKNAAWSVWHEWHERPVMPAKCKLCNNCSIILLCVCALWNCSVCAV